MWEKRYEPKSGTVHVGESSPGCKWSLWGVDGRLRKKMADFSQLYPSKTLPLVYVNFVNDQRAYFFFMCFSIHGWVLSKMTKESYIVGDLLLPVIDWSVQVIVLLTEPQRNRWQSQKSKVLKFRWGHISHLNIKVCTYHYIVLFSRIH